MEWSIGNATLAGRDGRWRVELAGGRIAAVREEPSSASGMAAAAYDAGGRLLSPGFIDPHVHVDKTLTADRVSDDKRGADARERTLTGGHAPVLHPCPCRSDGWREPSSLHFSPM